MDACEDAAAAATELLAMDNHEDEREIDCAPGAGSDAP
jgi:hypothetical protein